MKAIITLLKSRCWNSKGVFLALIGIMEVRAFGLAIANAWPPFIGGQRQFWEGLNFAIAFSAFWYLATFVWRFGRSYEYRRLISEILEGGARLAIMPFVLRAAHQVMLPAFGTATGRTLLGPLAGFVGIGYLLWLQIPPFFENQEPTRLIVGGSS